jgi:hypothetical protein
MRCSDRAFGLVRRQGLEPRTRGLRARTGSCRLGSARASSCRLRRSAAGRRVATRRLVPVAWVATEHRWSTATGGRCSIDGRRGGVAERSNQRTFDPLPVCPLCRRSERCDTRAACRRPNERHSAAQEAIRTTIGTSDFADERASSIALRPSAVEHVIARVGDTNDKGDHRPGPVTDEVPASQPEPVDRSGRGRRGRWRCGVQAGESAPPAGCYALSGRDSPLAPLDGEEMANSVRRAATFLFLLEPLVQN